MADSKLTDLTALTTVAAGDLFYVVDISDTTDDAAGSSKKITLEKVLTTPTVTGVLTVLQSGGTPGSTEGQISHNGSVLLMENKANVSDGSITLAMTPGAGTAIFRVKFNNTTSFRVGSVFEFGTNPLTFSSGSPDSVAADVGIKRTSAGVLEINNTTAGQWGQLKLGTYDSGTTTITDGLIVGHRSSGTPAAGLGSAILFNIDSSTTADQAAGRLSFSWATATHASRVSQFIASIYNISTEKQVIKSFVSGSNVITQLGTAGGDAIIIGENGNYDGVRLHAVGGAAALLVARGNATSEGSVQAASYSTLAAGVFYAQFRIDGIRMNSLCSLGISSSTGSVGTEDISLARNAASVFEMNNGTAGRWGALKLGTYDSGTNTITNGLTVGHRSSGTPAAGLGSAILFNIDSSTTADQNAARVQSSWTVATHASRTSEVGIKTVTNAGSLAEVARFDGGGGASPSAGNTGFMLFDVDNNTLERVTVGAADSGGTGYKVLRIPN